jgi:hypothetical protein
LKNPGFFRWDLPFKAPEALAADSGQIADPENAVNFASSIGLFLHLPPKSFANSSQSAAYLA